MIRIWPSRWRRCRTMPETVSNPAETHAASGAVRTEPTDVNVRGILYVGAGLLVVGVIVQFAGYWTFEALRGREGNTSQFLLSSQRDRLPPEPRLEQLDRMEGQQGGEMARRLA